MLPYYIFWDYYVPRLYQTLLQTILVIITEVFSNTLKIFSLIMSHIYNPAVFEKTYHLTELNNEG